MVGGQGARQQTQILNCDRLVRNKLESCIIEELFHDIYLHSPWDIKECLFPQCILSQVQFPHYAAKWIDARKLFSSFYRIKSGNLASMLEKIGLKFEGREHCGLHDSENIARVMERLIRDGCVLKYNRFMPQDLVNSFDQSKKS